MSETDYLLLKWGTVKGFGLHGEEAEKLWDEYCKLGASLSVILQHDTPEQKKLICKMIDLCKGKIQNDWDGEFYTKKQAKNYILEYES